MTSSKENPGNDICFLGEREHAVDSQRRIALSRKWRGEDDSLNRFFILPGRSRSLQLVPASIFNELMQKLRKVSFADAQAAVALAGIGSMAQEVTCDKQGRISINAKLLEHAGITDSALLIGAVTTIQIWEPAAWNDQKMDSESGLDVIQAIQERPDDFADVIRRTVEG